MLRRIWHFLQRRRAYRQLDRRQPNLDSAVRTYIDAGGRCMEELCDALCLTPFQLYYSVSESEKDNVRLNLNDENREELVHLILQKVHHG